MACGVFINRVNLIAAQSIGRVESGEAAQSHFERSVVRAEPQIAVAIFSQRSQFNTAQSLYRGEAVKTPSRKFGQSFFGRNPDAAVGGLVQRGHPGIS